MQDQSGGRGLSGWQVHGQGEGLSGWGGLGEVVWGWSGESQVRVGGRGVWVGWREVLHDNDDMCMTP